MGKKKICFTCYQRSSLYQPPEIGLKPLSLFPEQLTDKEGECEVHNWSPTEIWQEILGWIDGE